MSASKLPQYVLQELPNVTEIINSPLKSAPRIKYTCFDVSKSLIAFGATSGGIYVFNRHPCEFLQLIPNKDGAITRLAVSHDERHIGFGNGRGLLAVTACEQASGNRTVTSKEHQGNEITALAWAQHTLFTGDDTGRISVLVLPSLISKSIFQTGSQTIMSLDSRICQLDVRGSMLLACSLTRSYICDTAVEQFRQIGNKLRDGEYGACFFTMGRSRMNGHDEVSHQENTETKQYNIVVTDAAFKVNEKLKDTVIFCARPSSRVWEASIDGTVVRTHQFKQVLAREPQKPILNSDFEKETVAIDSFSNEVESKSSNFPKLLSIKNSAIFSFKKDALYVLNVQNVGETMWCEYKDKNIVDCKILNDIIYVWLQNGSLISLKYMKIDKYLVKCFLEAKYDLCAALCALYRDYLISNTLSDKLKVVTGLREHLEEDKLKTIEDVLMKFNELKDNAAAQMKSGVVVVDNSYHNQTELSDEEDTKTSLDENKFPTLKVLSTTVSDKINTSKKLLKETWEGFEDKMKQLGETKQQSLEVDVPKRTHDETENDDLKIEYETEIVFKESSQIVIEDIEEVKETDKICKSLYQNYIMKAICEEESKPTTKEIIDCYSCDIKEIYKLMLIVEDYCFTIDAVEEPKFVTSSIFLSYINNSNRELLNHIIQDDLLYKFFVESCIAVNSRSLRTLNMGCECGFPLPFTDTQPPEYSEIIDDFIEKQWSVQTKEQCYEMCKRMPYLWRKILHLRRNEDLANLLTILLQLLDESLLHSFLPQFTMETWDRAVQLYAILQTNICLNCKRKFDHMSVKNTLSWNDLGALIIKSVGGKNAIKIMERHSGLIEVGELSIKFYHTSLLVAAFEKCDVTTKNALVDTLYSCLDVDEARNEICNLLITTKNGEIKNTALPIIAAANSTHWGIKIINKNPEIYSEYDEESYAESNSSEFSQKSVTMADISEFLSTTDCQLCGLPLTNEVLIQDGGLWSFICGHVFHGACLDLNKVKLCPSCVVNI